MNTLQVVRISLAKIGGQKKKEILAIKVTIVAPSYYSSLSKITYAA